MTVRRLTLTNIDIREPVNHRTVRQFKRRKDTMSVLCFTVNNDDVTGHSK